MVIRIQQSSTKTQRASKSPLRLRTETFIEHLKAVNESVYRWSLLLGEYYHSPQYAKLAATLEFKKGRHLADGFAERTVLHPNAEQTQR
jgi:hypothetical protein